jgi:omega-6 fatty acid desaturase (delta-12 desaturase)
LHNKESCAPDNARARLLAITSAYAGGSTGRSVRQLAVSLGLYLSCHLAGMAALREGLGVVALALVLPTGLFIVRLFVIQHDCGHRSFFHSRRANDCIGSCLGVITMTPYHCWRRFHAQHHIHSGNLDRRGLGDISVVTRAEYSALPPSSRLLYRLYRHPLVLFLIGPTLLFVLRQRTTYKVPLEWHAERLSVHWTNCGVAALLLSQFGLFGIGGLAFSLAAMSVASTVGVWLFYVQHQFPDAYWKREAQWESWRASMTGATYYELPPVLRWLTANIGLHHIHHLDARIPNYRLYECFLRHAEFADPPRLGLRDSFACARLRLWDEQIERLVPFPPAGQGGRT